MDLAKIVEFAEQNVAGWTWVARQTLIRPVARFEFTYVTGAGFAETVGPIKDERQLWLHPRLIAYAIISIILGQLIERLIPGKRPDVDLWNAVVFLIVYLLVNGTALHVFCRLLRGRGKYIETLSVILQVSATLYVLCSFITVLIVPFLGFTIVAESLKTIPCCGILMIEQPAFIFSVISALFSAIYIPMALKSVHKFGWIRTSILCMLPLLTLWFTLPLSESTSIDFIPPPMTSIGL